MLARLSRGDIISLMAIYLAVCVNLLAFLYLPGAKPASEESSSGQAGSFLGSEFYQVEPYQVQPLIWENPQGHLADPKKLREDVQWNAEPADALIPGKVVELSPVLQRLHATALTAFESAPNFSYQRMPSMYFKSSPPRHVPLLSK